MQAHDIDSFRFVPGGDATLPPRRSRLKVNRRAISTHSLMKLAQQYRIHDRRLCTPEQVRWHQQCRRANAPVPWRWRRSKRLVVLVVATITHSHMLVLARDNHITLDGVLLTATGID
eukprot:1126766-Pleurochrysis_carterae.AAC.2